jgi:hypothetical protein
MMSLTLLTGGEVWPSFMPHYVLTREDIAFLQ